MTYIGTDWRTALERNVTVALEFAEHELDDAEGIGDAALLIREALDECNRLLRDSPPMTHTDVSRGAPVLAVDKALQAPTSRSIPEGVVDSALTLLSSARPATGSAAPTEQVPEAMCACHHDLGQHDNAGTVPTRWCFGCNAKCSFVPALAVDSLVKWARFVAVHSEHSLVRSWAKQVLDLAAILATERTARARAAQPDQTRAVAFGVCMMRHHMAPDEIPCDECVTVAAHELRARVTPAAVDRAEEGSR